MFVCVCGSLSTAVVQTNGQYKSYLLGGPIKEVSGARFYCNQKFSSSQPFGHYQTYPYRALESS